MLEKRYALGVGCRAGASAHVLDTLVKLVLADAAIDAAELAFIATLTGKGQEPAVRSLGISLDLEILTFPAERLEDETPRLLNPSETVFRETGCHGVAEAAALAAMGSLATLIVPKRVLDGCTVAVATRNS